jgi:hypothetical protein
MKVAIYHPFHDLPDNYSLSHIVVEQMLMLIEHGVETCFVTSDDFGKDVKWDRWLNKQCKEHPGRIFTTPPPSQAIINTRNQVPEGVQLRAVLPWKGVEAIRKSCEYILKTCTHVLTHDIVYLDSYRDHEEALRQIALDNPDIHWLHWSHSAPSTGKHKPFPNSTYIGMNYTDLPLVAEQFGVPQAQCRVVYNSVSPDVFFGWHPFTKHLVEKHKLLDCDVLITYPLDTGRFEAKGGFKIVKLVEKLREQKKNAKVVFVNAAANTKERTTFAKALNNEYTIFTSLEDNQYVVVVPRRVVRELLQISNVFPLLSTSEGCSLIMLEAALAKNLIILNEDFPPLLEFGGPVSESGNIFHTSPMALYMKVSSTRAHTDYNPSEDNYYADWARRVLEELEKNRVLKFNRKALKRFNREWIWQNQLEPLLN